MKTYGHLRDEHSVNMAKKVTFGTATPQPDMTTGPRDGGAGHIHV